MSPDSLATRRPKDFDQSNPPKDVTDPEAPAGGRDSRYPAHVHRVVAETHPDRQVLTIGGQLIEFRRVESDTERAEAYKEGFCASPVAALAADAKKADAKKKD